jgi:hypothetical protein
MLSIRMENLLRTMMAGGGVSAQPVRVTWPVHRALIWLGEETGKQAATEWTDLTIRPDPDACRAVQGAEFALSLLIDEGFLVKSGEGYTAKWEVDPDQAANARRVLMREDPQVAVLLTQAGQRLARWASTAVKNAETAAESWASPVTGPTPTVRQPPLVALR